MHLQVKLGSGVYCFEITGFGRDVPATKDGGFRRFLLAVLIRVPESNAFFAVDGHTYLANSPDLLIAACVGFGCILDYVDLTKVWFFNCVGVALRD